VYVYLFYVSNNNNNISIPVYGKDEVFVKRSKMVILARDKQIPDFQANEGYNFALFSCFEYYIVLYIEKL